ncbi:uncharacterized protein [Manis javanica]|uniref:uncharacterized protein isoform X3 n=1 Tax=Manis javanica TaxID=9974 RepID=UPI003C6D78A7
MVEASFKDGTVEGTLNNEHEQGMLHGEGSVGLMPAPSVVGGRDRSQPTSHMLVPPARAARFWCPPCFSPTVCSHLQQRKHSACARPPVSPLRCQGLPLKPPSLAKALRCLPVPSNSDRPRPPPAGSRGPPRQGPPSPGTPLARDPAPSSSRRPVLLAGAAHAQPPTPEPSRLSPPAGASR